MIAIREVHDPADPAIEAFGRTQTAAYFAPEMLIPAGYISRLLTDSRRNHLVVAEEDGRVVGGTLFHYLADAGTGFSSFMGVERTLRGRGIGRSLHEERFRVLDEAAGGHVPGVFIDVVNPTRVSPSDLARDHRVGFDPWKRRRAFGHLGFRQIDIEYQQPVGGPNGGPVTDLDLLYCPHDPADTVPTALVIATMRAYWTPWLGKSAARYAKELEDRAHGAKDLALIWPEPPKPDGR